jgi:riboflavin synthase
MFTGIVEETGVVERVRPTGNAIQLTVRPRLCAQGLKVGDSLAVNGCCLTVVQVAGRVPRKQVRFDLLQETWQRTNLQFVQPGSLVNLERSLRADSRLGGHFVTGHIDGVGRIRRWERSGTDWVLDLDAPPEVLRYVVFKGSIAVDGISLTVAETLPRGFRIWIIPHTWEVTALRERNVGDAVNLEADLVGKYVEQMLGKMDLRPGRQARPVRRRSR